MHLRSSKAAGCAVYLLNINLRSPEVRRCNRSEALLSGGIPNLLPTRMANRNMLVIRPPSGEYGKSHISTCNLIRFPSSSMFLILKSMPIVAINVGEKESFAYLSKRQVFPTPAYNTVKINLRGAAFDCQTNGVCRT